MAKVTSRTELRDYCLRRLGWPVIDINIDDDQIDDRIDDALSFYYDYHFDGTEKLFMKHQFTQDDIDRRWIYCPDPVIFVTGVMPFDDSNSSVNMFDLRYQLRLHDLYDFTSVSYVSYEITMQHIRTLNLLFSGTPQFRFQRHTNKLYLDIDWQRDARVGEYVVIECYRRLSPETITITGTVSGTAGANTLTGTSTIFDQELVNGDIITLSNGDEVQIKSVTSSSQLELNKALVNTVTANTITKAGVSDVWNDRFLKAYATAKIKYQWGSNLSKFAGIQLPGGVTLDGPRIMEEAKAELDKMEEEMFSLNVLPSDFFLG
jgi:hypothetical protein